MNTIWISSDGAVSPLGLSSDITYKNIIAGNTGIQPISDKRLSQNTIFAGQIPGFEEGADGNSRFENLCLSAMNQAIKNISLPKEKTLFILSTTKGNISFLEEGKPHHPRIHLPATAKHLASCIGLAHYTVVCNACVSGVMALIVAKRFLESGKYDHALVVGADVLSQFVVSGFQCLQALSPAPCKPFDKHRNGINLGESAAAVVLTSKPEELNTVPLIKIAGGGLSNDANHISGPSRTGEELGSAVLQALQEAEMERTEIDFISAHGTATRYNDEMEAKAFTSIGLNQTLTHSLKGYFGHTLGAAGVLETIIGMKSLLQNEVIPTMGCDQIDYPSINICQKIENKILTSCMKTASGFGGCNAAIVLKKVN
jgi:3-oxoacyl-[acyl-carrier-protein] synthase I